MVQPTVGLVTGRGISNMNDRTSNKNINRKKFFKFVGIGTLGIWLFNSISIKKILKSNTVKKIEVHQNPLAIKRNDGGVKNG